MSAKRDNINTERNLNIEDRLTDEQREKIRAIDRLNIGAYPRAMSVLVALEMKPATEIPVGPHNDSPADIKKTLEAAGLKVVQQSAEPETEGEVSLIVAKDEAVVQEMQRLSATTDRRRYGELMGFTPTMMDAFERKIERLLNKERPSEPAAQIFNVILSHAHIKEEMEVLRKWEAAIKKYAPDTYNELLGEQKPEKLPEDADLNSAEVIEDIFERGIPEEMERFRAFHSLTKEQINLMHYFAQLRKITLDQMQVDLAARIDQRPLADEEELALGAYREEIEPQVRDAILTLRRKGYETTSSGFGGLPVQAIYFGKSYDFQLPESLIAKLKQEGVSVRQAEDGLSFDCERQLSIEALAKIWNQIVKAVPDRGTPAAPSKIKAAESFRKRQEALKIKEE